MRYEKKGYDFKLIKEGNTFILDVLESRVYFQDYDKARFHFIALIERTK